MILGKVQLALLLIVEQYASNCPTGGLAWYAGIDGQPASLVITDVERRSLARLGMRGLIAWEPERLYLTDLGRAELARRRAAPAADLRGTSQSDRMNRRRREPRRRSNHQPRDCAGRFTEED